MKTHKFLSILLAAITMLSAITAAPSVGAAHRLRSGDFLFKVLDDGTLEAERYVGQYEEEADIIVPSEFCGYKVSAIGENIMICISKVNRFVIPDTVERMSIRHYQDINTLVIGKNLKTFSTHILSYAKKVVCKNKYYSVVGTGLYNKSITKLLYCPVNNFNTDRTFTVPDSVKTIGKIAFRDLDSFYSYTIDLNNVTKVDDYAFMFANISSMVIKSDVKLIGESAFSNCEYLKDLKLSANKNLKILDYAFLGTDISSIKLSGHIGRFAFCDCKNLQKVILTSNVKEVKKGAFLNCAKLRSVYIPENVRKIGAKSFGYNRSKSGSSYKYTKIKGFIIKGKKGSAAEKYAKKNGIKFKAVKL